jgi:hypothetical protein
MQQLQLLCEEFSFSVLCVLRLYVGSAREDRVVWCCQKKHHSILYAQSTHTHRLRCGLKQLKLKRLKQATKTVHIYIYI